MDIEKIGSDIAKQVVLVACRVIKAVFYFASEKKNNDKK